MSLKKVLHRSMEDASFCEELRADPETAVQKYDLSDEELEALQAGDSSLISELLDDSSSDGLAKKPGYVVEYSS